MEKTTHVGKNLYRACFGSKGSCVKTDKSVGNEDFKCENDQTNKDKQTIKYRGSGGGKLYSSALS